MDSKDAVNKLQSGNQNALKEFQTTGAIKSKSDESFGLRIAKQIGNEISGSYFADRNRRFRANRMLANGKMDDKLFLELLGMDLKESTDVNYIKLYTETIKVVHTIVAGLVGRWKQNREKIVVKAIDKKSKKEKKDEYNEAEFLMNHGDMVADLQEATGLPMTKQNQFIPEDKDQLDLWADEELKIDQEIKFELKINDINQANGLYDTVKDMLLTDSAEVGLIGIEDYMQSDGSIKSEYLVPERLYYSDSIYPDFRDNTWRAYRTTYKIIEIRELYPKVAANERKMFAIAQKSSQYKPSEIYGYQSSWETASERPYDDWSVEVIRYYIKTSDSDTIQMAVTKNGSLITRTNENIDYKKKNVTYRKDENYSIYKGVYVKDTEIMLEWGLQENMIKSQDPQEIGNVEFPISLYMYKPSKMRNIAVPEKVEYAVKMMMLTLYKIQQILVTLTPPGSAYDIDAMQELDLGTGNVFQPHELVRQRHQTGDFYFQGRDAEGNKLSFPVTAMPNSEGFQQLQGLMSTYAFHQQVLRDEVGINENAEGQSPKARVTNDNYQSSLAVSFNRTDYMYDAYISLMEDSAKKKGCLLHDSAEWSDHYSDVLSKEDVKDRQFETTVKMLPTDEEVAYLDGLITNMITANPIFIQYFDPIRCRDMARDNLKKANKYFRDCQKKMQKGEMEKSAQLQQQNADTQVQAAQAAAQSQEQLEQLKAKIAQAEQQAKGMSDQKVALTTMFTQLYGSGASIPVSLQPLEQAFVQNILLPLVAETEQQKQAIVANMQAQQQQAENSQPSPEQMQGIA